MGKLIHYYKTYQWALEVGFSEEEARRIAYADWRVDFRGRGDKYRRGRHLNTNLASRFGGMPSQLWYAAYHLAWAIRSHSLDELGTSLHSLQDWVGHGDWPLYGNHWKGPWRIKLFGREVRLRRYDPDTDLSRERLEALEAATKRYLTDYLDATRVKRV